MESARESKTVTTPAGRAVVLKTYLTARESNDIKSVMYAMVKMDMPDVASGLTEIKDVPATVVLEQEKKALSLIVISIDGKTDNVLEQLLDLREEEYQFVVDEVNKIRNGNLTPAK